MISWFNTWKCWMMYTKEDKTTHCKVNWAQTYLIILYFRFHNILSMLPKVPSLPPLHGEGGLKAWRRRHECGEECGLSGDGGDQWQVQWWWPWSAQPGVTTGDRRHQAQCDRGLQEITHLQGVKWFDFLRMGTVRQNMLGIVLLILSLKGNIQT